MGQISARILIPKTLLSDNDPEFLSGDRKQLFESLEIRKMESPTYHPRAYERAELAVQIMKWAIPA